VWLWFQIQQVEKELVELRERKGPFDRAVRGLTASIRESYESIIFEDQDLATAEAAEQLLWRLHYRCIEEFRVRLRKLGSAAAAANHHHHRRSSAKKRGGPEEKFVRVGAQYKSFLDEVTGFYHGLIAKVRARHGLSPDLSASGGIRMMSVEELQRCQSMCHRCLIYLGDLARYKELHAVVEGRAADWSVAASYYQQSSKLWPHDGNSHNQLAVLATYTGDNMQAVYHYFFSLAVATPFVTARANVKLLFETVGNEHTFPLLATVD
jgi:protein SMG7